MADIHQLAASYVRMAEQIVSRICISLKKKKPSVSVLAVFVAYYFN